MGKSENGKEREDIDLVVNFISSAHEIKLSGLGCIFGALTS